MPCMDGTPRFLLVGKTKVVLPIRKRIMAELPGAEVDELSGAPSEETFLASHVSQRQYDALIVDLHTAISSKATTDRHWLFRNRPNTPVILLSADSKWKGGLLRLEATSNFVTTVPFAHHGHAPAHEFVGQVRESWEDTLIEALRAVVEKKPLFSFSPSPEVLTASSSALCLLQQKYPDPKKLLSLTPRQFEELIAEVWSRFGYSVELTRQTRDNGRDIIAVRKSEAEVRFLIECKRYAPSRKVDVALVRALYGVKVHEQATKAILATTSTFTKPALEIFDTHKWELEARDMTGVMNWISRANAQRPRMVPR